MPRTSSERYAVINLPHAQTVLGRIERCIHALRQSPDEEAGLFDILESLDRILRPYVHDPPEAEAIAVADGAADEARRLVEAIEKAGYRGDRLGQCVRNFFECLGLEAEGGELSLRCGERPDSPLRP